MSSTGRVGDQCVYTVQTVRLDLSSSQYAQSLWLCGWIHCTIVLHIIITLWYYQYNMEADLDFIGVKAHVNWFAETFLSLCYWHFGVINALPFLLSLSFVFCLFFNFLLWLLWTPHPLSPIALPYFTSGPLPSRLSLPPHVSSLLFILFLHLPPSSLILRQYYCCKKEESESEEEEPDFAVTSRLPPVHSNHNIVAATASASSIPNGPALFSTPPLARKLTRSQTFCPSCTHYELPFYLQPPQPQLHHQPDGLRNGGDRISYRSVQQQDLDLPVPVNISNYRKPNLARSATMRDMFTRSCSISTDV